jgi:hypothetical protein
VDDTAPIRPGVYAWVTDGNVIYVGMASQLRQVAHGTRMDSAYNAYAYIPAPKVVQINSPRVRVNGLLNRSIVAGATVMLWCLETATAIRQCAACPANAAWSATSCSEHRDPDDGGVLSAGRGRPVRTLTWCFVPALAVVVPASRCGVRCLSFVKPRGACRIGGTRDMPVQALFPQGGGCLQLASSPGWSRVSGIDAVGGPPHCDFANEVGGVCSRWCPD